MTSAACVPVLAANSAGGRPGIRVPASGCWQQGGRSGTSSCIQVTGWPRAEFPESKGKIVTTSNFFKGIAPKISCAPKPRTRSHIACIYAAPIPTISRRDVCPHGEWTLFFKPFHTLPYNLRSQNKVANPVHCWKISFRNFKNFLERIARMSTSSDARRNKDIQKREFQECTILPRMKAAKDHRFQDIVPKQGSVVVSVKLLQNYFHLPLNSASKILGICSTVLKQ